MLEQQIERLEHQQTDPQVDPNEEDWQLMQDAKEGTTGLLQRVKAGEEASTRQDKRYTHVDGEITSNAQKVATTVTIAVRWFDTNDKVVARQATPLFNLAPGETLRSAPPPRKTQKSFGTMLRWTTHTKRFAQEQLGESFRCSNQLRRIFPREREQLHSSPLP